MGIKEDLPTLARHEGVWDGTYRYYNAEGKLVDEHTSRLFCRFPDEGPFPYHQTNHYTWADGRTEVREFPAEYRDGRIWWDNDLIKGWASDMTLDTNNRTTVLYWQRTGDPELYLYEMIQLSDDGKKRCRTWHWIRGGVLETRTAIEEKLVSRDWRGMEADMVKKAA
ncbi:DUF3598 domain-containing protein [Sandaracinobacteroides saxicola]|uniref:DUF3598 domain-containing protein n=1 Tax=Sandaracinobacteroides saxicola TaxID=2759707 RepID=A0A7G5IED1_9SPHN|nr:DUF3598 domain-containing protein [Sandaracinobacteroides saxicola]QMW21723.1 DUF3598 domain-containing protein [Sandaracinobacteroides saxicola]